MRHRHRHLNSRTLWGKHAIAWLDLPTGVARVTAHAGAHGRVHARAAVRDRRWGLVVAPTVLGGLTLELAYALECKKCGHRLLPNQLARRGQHNLTHPPKV